MTKTTTKPAPNVSSQTTAEPEVDDDDGSYEIKD